MGAHISDAMPFVSLRRLFITKCECVALRSQTHSSTFHKRNTIASDICRALGSSLICVCVSVCACIVGVIERLNRENGFIVFKPIHR